MKAFLALLLVALLNGGCFVFDEIEKGQELMASHDPHQKEAAADAAASEPKSARERLSEYYAKQRAKAAKSEGTDDPRDAAGVCRIGGTTKFMRRVDCELRGGTFR